MGFWTEYNPATGIVFEGLADQGDTGGGGSASTWSGATPEQLFAAARAGRISWAQVKMELQSQRTGVSDLNPEGTRKYGDSIIDSMIDEARAKADSSSSKSGGGSGAINNPSDIMSALQSDGGTVEANAPTTGRSIGGTYSEGAERWRQEAYNTMPAALRARPDAEMLLDKMVYVIDGESGGRDEVMHDGGAGYGLVGDRIERTPVGTPARQQLINAWNLVSKNPDKWTDWGEGTLYNGEPFGALGRAPYNSGGSSSTSTAKSGSAGSGGWGGGTGGFGDDAKTAISNFMKWQGPQFDALKGKAGAMDPGDILDAKAALADMARQFQQQYLEPSRLAGFSDYTQGMDLPSSNSLTRAGFPADGGAAAAPAPAAGGTSAMAKLLGGNYGTKPEDYKGFGFAEGGSVGPAGRSFEQATGQDYLSEEERAWYLAEAKRRGGVLDQGAQQFLGDYEARAPQQAPAIGTGGYQQRELTPTELAKINAQKTAVAASTATGSPAPALPAQPQASSSAQSSAASSQGGGTFNDDARTAISNFLKWRGPQFDALKGAAGAMDPGDILNMRARLADEARMFQQNQLEPSRLPGFVEYAGMDLPSSRSLTRAGFANGGTVEALSNMNSTLDRWQPRARATASMERAPSTFDEAAQRSVPRFIGPYETDVNLMGKRAAFGGFENLSNILTSLNRVGRDFQHTGSGDAPGSVLSAGYRIPGFNPLQSEVYQRLFRTDVPSNIQYAAGGTAGPMLGENPGMVAQNPDGTPHLMLNEPADLIGRESGRHYAEAGEVGTMEGVSADGQGGLNFTPTGIPQVGPQTQLAVGSAIMQLLSGRRSNQRRGRYKPAPVGSTPPPPSRRVNELLGVA